ncbi:MAG TPA: ribonuclease M5 [Candidatus Avacidaminococcus intestinavium]|uniref:Ribonuclease M5 n=1 Tax=Candidatus Avacidaminococcus intestinavium TaxID=2840684 RepID=A0A9D1MQ15_9FIRM|nr:ribonuclease M5 [Candidatus Avacidaminococcus intestinavium]
MLREVIVVEGKMDTVAIKKAVDAETIETGGFTLAARTIEKIKVASEKRGIIILTDPDGAGERIRKFLTERFPKAGQAFVPRVDATANNDVGIEQATPEAIRLALSKVRYHECIRRTEFTSQDLLRHGLSGQLAATKRRAQLGMLLGIGYANAKQFTNRLNSYGVTREEFLKAVQALEE